jgi:hypothetical protein
MSEIHYKYQMKLANLKSQDEEIVEEVEKWKK